MAELLKVLYLVTRGWWGEQVSKTGIAPVLYVERIADFLKVAPILAAQLSLPDPLLLQYTLEVVLHAPRHCLCALLGRPVNSQQAALAITTEERPGAASVTERHWDPDNPGVVTERAWHADRPVTPPEACAAVDSQEDATVSASEANVLENVLQYLQSQMAAPPSELAAAILPPVAFLRSVSLESRPLRRFIRSKASSRYDGGIASIMAHQTCGLFCED